MSKPESSTASPRSIHRKLRVVLSEARTGGTLTLDDLVQRVAAAGHSDFTRYASESGRVKVVSCSPEVIRRVTRLALELGLIDEGGRLSSSGVKAVVDDTAFNKVVSRAAEASMRQLGVSAMDLDEQLRHGLSKASLDSVPTVDNLVSSFRRRGVDQKAFRLYLQLLASCGGIATVRKKLYLPRR